MAALMAQECGSCDAVSTMPDETHGHPGVATLVIAMPGSVRPPTDTADTMIAWLSHHGAPRTAEMLRRLERHGWTVEPPDPDSPTQAELLCTARFADLAEAEAAARPYPERVRESMRWAPAER